MLGCIYVDTFGTVNSAQAQISGYSSCWTCSNKTTPTAKPEHIKADRLLSQYFRGDIQEKRKIEELIDSLASAGAPYQAARMMEREFATGRLPLTGENYLKLALLFQRAREDEKALVIVKHALRDKDLKYLDFLRLQRVRKELQEKLDAADIKKIRQAFRQKRRPRYVCDFGKNEMCYMDIKRAYDAEIFVGKFQLDDPNCRTFKAEYDRKYRSASAG